MTLVLVKLELNYSRFYLYLLQGNIVFVYIPPPKSSLL